ncbi:MAG TPA: VOC family protein [Gammaproteobacteria bacterium]
MELLVNIDVSDLQEAMLFYTEAFGLKVGRRFGGEAAELLGVSSSIYLLQKARGTPAAKGIPQRRDYDRHWTPVHLDFVVPDVEAAVQRAVTAGARLEGEIRTHKWGRIAVLADPFGHGVCILQFLGRGYDEISS